MKKKLPLFLAACLLSGCAAPGGETGYRQVSMAEAMEIMEKNTGCVILDVRTPEEYAHRHIPGAVNVPNETIGAEAIPQLPDKGQLILVYCRSGNRSKQAAEKLAKQGYRNIVEFGGINSWPGDTVSGNS